MTTDSIAKIIYKTLGNFAPAPEWEDYKTNRGLVLVREAWKAAETIQKGLEPTPRSELLDKAILVKTTGKAFLNHCSDDPSRSESFLASGHPDSFALELTSDELATFLRRYHEHHISQVFKIVKTHLLKAFHSTWVDKLQLEVAREITSKDPGSAESMLRNALEQEIHNDAVEHNQRIADRLMAEAQPVDPSLGVTGPKGGPGYAGYSGPGLGIKGVMSEPPACVEGEVQASTDQHPPAPAHVSDTPLVQDTIACAGTDNPLGTHAQTPGLSTPTPSGNPPIPGAQPPTSPAPAMFVPVCPITMPAKSGDISTGPAAQTGDTQPVTSVSASTVICKLHSSMYRSANSACPPVLRLKFGLWAPKHSPKDVYDQLMGFHPIQIRFKLNPQSIGQTYRAKTNHWKNDVALVVLEASSLSLEVQAMFIMGSVEYTDCGSIKCAVEVVNGLTVITVNKTDLDLYRLNKLSAPLGITSQSLDDAFHIPEPVNPVLSSDWVAILNKDLAADSASRGTDRRLLQMNMVGYNATIHQPKRDHDVTIFIEVGRVSAREKLVDNFKAGHPWACAIVSHTDQDMFNVKKVYVDGNFLAVTFCAPRNAGALFMAYLFPVGHSTLSTTVPVVPSFHSGRFVLSMAKGQLDAMALEVENKREASTPRVSDLGKPDQDVVKFIQENANLADAKLKLNRRFKLWSVWDTQQNVYIEMFAGSMPQVERVRQEWFVNTPAGLMIKRGPQVLYNLRIRSANACHDTVQNKIYLQVIAAKPREGLPFFTPPYWVGDATCEFVALGDATLVNLFLDDLKTR